jgi:SAM-dependent methyltransferase
LHDTTAYHAGDIPPSLFWELTICECLGDGASPYQSALERPAPYGELLARFLEARVGLAPTWRVVEVGGGTGSLMAALRRTVPLAEVTMVDLSPAFLARQRQTLAGYPQCRFVARDALDFLAGLDREVDLVISNENLGDLAQVTGIERASLARAVAGGEDGPDPLGQVAEVVRRYRLDLSDAPERFAFNLGPIRYLERLWPVAKRVFLSEHGADTVVPAPWGEFLSPTPGDGYPRRIPLKGHDEYTIRFGHLARVAQGLGYRVERCHMAELVGLRADEGIRCMARAGTRATERAEVVHEFCEHVADYQCMVLVRDA